jgi:hypothetical protein
MPPTLASASDKRGRLFDGVDQVDRGGQVVFAAEGAEDVPDRQMA